MPGPTTEVLSDDLKDLRTDVHRVEVTLSTAVAKLAAEFAVFKWLLGLTLVASLSGIISSAYWSGSLESRLTALVSRADKTDVRLERIEARLGSIDGRLERIEVILTKAFANANEARSVTPAKR